MKFNSSLVAAALVGYAVAAPSSSLVVRAEGKCDAKKCARSVFARAGEVTGCIAGGAAAAIGFATIAPAAAAAAPVAGPFLGVLTSAVCEKVFVGMPECAGCTETTQNCATNDAKAIGKACGPGNLAQLGVGMCVQLKSSVPNPDEKTDQVEGDYVVHCANEPKLPAGTTNNGGTCYFKCNQCQQCQDNGKGGPKPPSKEEIEKAMQEVIDKQ